jgi:hypothetical protein
MARPHFNTRTQTILALLVIAGEGQFSLPVRGQNTAPAQHAPVSAAVSTPLASPTQSLPSTVETSAVRPIDPPAAVTAPPAALTPPVVSTSILTAPASVGASGTVTGQQAAASAPAPQPAAIAPQLSGFAGQSSKDKEERPFPIGSKFSRSLQTVTGVTFISQAIANHVASKVASKRLGGDVKVHMHLYGLTDLLAGKVKSMSVVGDGCSYKMMPLGQVKLTSKRPIWFDWHKQNGKTVGLREPIYLAISGSLRQEDVCKALSSEAVTRSLRGLRLDLPGLGDQQLQILNPQVKLLPHRITISSKMVTKGASADTGIDMVISAAPVLSGSKIVLIDTVIACPDIIDPASFATFVQDLFNPIVDFGRYDRSDHAFRLAKFAIEKDRVIGDGNLLLVPRASLAGNKASESQLLK